MKGNAEEFQKSALYLRSLDLHYEVNQFLKSNDELMRPTDKQELRKYATTVPRKIAHAMGQTNIKIRFKKLNEAKNSLRQLQSLLVEATSGEGRVQCKKVEDYSIQVIKLLNYYFGHLKKKKQN